MKVVFGSLQLERSLKKLGFTPQQQTGSSHVKYSSPTNVEVTKGHRSFIIVILGRKAYDPHTASSYLRQIRVFGFTNKQIINALK